MLRMNFLIMRDLNAQIDCNGDCDVHTPRRKVTAAQIIYYARVTSPLLECFKEYAVYLNDAEQPVVRGTLEHRRGPQMIQFPEAAGHKDPDRVSLVAPRFTQPGRSGDRRVRLAGD